MAKCLLNRPYYSYNLTIYAVVVQLLSRVQLFVTPCTVASQLHYVPEFGQTHVSDAIQPSHPLSPSKYLILNYKLYEMNLLSNQQTPYYSTYSRL